MKRVISILIVAALALCLCACGGKSEDDKAEVWKLSSYEWRRTPMEGLELTEVTLNLMDDKTFTLDQEVTLNGEKGEATLSGKYTLEGSKLTLLSDTLKTANSKESVDPARETNATYSENSIVINFTVQDSPYFKSATLSK